MTRRVVGLFLLAVLAGSVGTLIARDPGYVLLVWSDFSFETSFWFAGVLLLLALLVLRGALAVFDLVFGSRSGVRAWNAGRLQRRAQRGTATGLLARARGDFGAARKALEGSAAHAAEPVLNHLEAARAAQAMGDLAGRDAHLRDALEADSKASLAVGIAQAELQLDAAQWEQALATLLELRRDAPRNAHVLKMLRRAFEAVGDEEGLLGLLPDLRKARLPEEELERLEREAWIGYLGAVGDGEDPAAAVKLAWGAVPKTLKNDAGLLAAAAQRLDVTGDGDGAAALLKGALDKEWNPALVEVYGRLAGGDAAQRGKQAKRWAKAHSGEPMFELTRARLALRSERFGEARTHYAASLALRESPEACAELGRLELRLGDSERSAELLERALELRAAPPLDLPLPAPPGALERAS